MPRELALFGVFFPTLLLVFLASMGVLWLADHLIGKRRWHRHTWHPALFRLALFTCVFSGLGLLMML